MVALTWPKVGAPSGHAASTWSSHRSKRSCNRWRTMVQCVVARTSSNEITSAQPTGASSLSRVKWHSPAHYREVTCGPYESPKAPGDTGLAHLLQCREEPFLAAVFLLQLTHPRSDAFQL